MGSVASTVDGSLRIKNRVTVSSSMSTLGYRPKRTESRIWKKYLHAHVPSHLTHSVYTREEHRYPLMEERIKQTVVHGYYGLLFSLKKEILA